MPQTLTPFTEALLEANISQDHIDTAISHTTRDHTSLPEALYRTGVNPNVISRALVKANLGTFLIAPDPPEPQALALLTAQQAEELNVIPAKYDNITRTATILTSDILNPGHREELKNLTNASIIQLVQVPLSAIKQFHNSYYTNETTATTSADTQTTDETNRQRLIPENIARKYNIVGLRTEGTSLVVAAGNQAPPSLAEDLRVTLNRHVRLERRPAHEVTNLLQTVYGTHTLSDGTTGENTSLADETQDALTIRELNDIIRYAKTIGASDIHIDPRADSAHVRIRKDGVLRTHQILPPSRQRPITARIKVLAGLNIAVSNAPQDGRIRIREIGLEADLRVATQPTTHGEKVSMRLLQDEKNIPTLDALSMHPFVFKNFTSLFNLPQGLIYVAGPTGSGKSSTVFSFLKEIHTPEKNTMTIEDPVEYELEGLNQTQINEDAGMTFASALRALVRHDPDNILIGETRDAITAQLATEAAITGHLVLSTIHTNDAASTVTRIIEMGVEPYLVSDALRAVLAQRLLRRVCQHCAEPYEPTEALSVALGLTPENTEGATFKQGAGCDKCNHTGYDGRVAVHELMMITPAIEDLIHKRAGRTEIAAAAHADGTRSLRFDAIEKAKAGITSLDEALKRTTIN